MAEQEGIQQHCVCVCVDSSEAVKGRNCSQFCSLNSLKGVI